MAQYTLVIDQGGHSTRALVFDKKGRPIAYSSEPVDDAIARQSNHIEYDIDHIIDATQTLLQRLAQQLSPKILKKIKAAAIIAQRSSILACDKNGKAVSQMISWQDTRNGSWLEQQQFDEHAIQQLCGLRSNPHMGASKIRWLLDKDPKIQQLARNDDVIFMPWGAYFLQRLTLLNSDEKSKPPQKIHFITDPVLATRTGLVEYQQCTWSETLLNLYAIPQKYLPAIVPSSYHYGYLNLQGTEIPISLLGGDQNFIPCAYGIDTIDNSIYLNMGTGAFMQASLPLATKKAKPHQLLKTAIAVENHTANNNLSIIEGTVNAAATLLDWWQTQLPRPFSYTELDQILEDSNKAPVFINTLAGTGSPYWLKPTEPVFLDEASAYSNEEKTLAIIESILFACKINIDIICEQNPTLGNIVISGGLSRANAICQALANLSSMSVKRYDDNEASARGVAFYLSQQKNYEPLDKPTIFNPDQNTVKTSGMHQRFKRYQKEMEILGSRK